MASFYVCSFLSENLILQLPSEIMHDYIWKQVINLSFSFIKPF